MVQIICHIWSLCYSLSYYANIGKKCCWNTTSHLEHPCFFHIPTSKHTNTPKSEKRLHWLGNGNYRVNAQSLCKGFIITRKVFLNQILWCVRLELWTEQFLWNPSSPAPSSRSSPESVPPAQPAASGSAGPSPPGCGSDMLNISPICKGYAGGLQGDLRS